MCHRISDFYDLKYRETTFLYNLEYNKMNVNC